MTKKLLEIGDIVIQINCDEKEARFEINDARQKFIITKGEADIVLDTSYGTISEWFSGSEGERIFSSGGIWELLCRDGKYILVLSSPKVGPTPYKVVVLTPDFKLGVIHMGFPDVNPKGLTHILEYPLDEILIVSLLAQGRGLQLHACGIGIEDKGILFCGRSGVGKSTIANLWNGTNSALILSDDRIILRERNAQYWAYGTPWHGEAALCCAERVKLSQIYFLKQASENKIQPLKPTDVVTRLFVTCFPTFYNQVGMEYTLQFITQLCEKIPCFELSFVPNREVIELVRNNM